MNCHTYLGSGSSNQGAPDLSEVGARRQGVETFKAYLANPAAVRQQRDELVLVPRRREPHEPRHLPGRQQGPAGLQARALLPEAEDLGRSTRIPCWREGLPRGHRRFGRSLCEGHPRCARRIRRRGRPVRLRAGVEVLATELYGDADAAARRGARALHRRQRPGHGLRHRATTSRPTRAARPRSTRTSSAPARCRRWERSPPGRWRTSSTGRPRWRSRSGASSCSSRARPRSRRSTSAGSRPCTRPAR